MEFINSYRIVVHDYLLKGNYQQRKLLLVGSGDDTLGILLGPSGGFGVQNIANC